ncbi:MAG: neutral/alkaline non-lysosomal ceramidase N-terminal domain-containing protein, partial [Spirochaetales bacterium]|nr:neutral/alkaline non-lysosomal ceramidase N-terminal domain-containing protein [Spirochaetales bacterium]
MSDTIRAGRAVTRITPPLGIRLQGSIARDQPARRVMDDLYAKTLLLESGGKRFALFTCDLIEFSREFVEQLRRDVEASHSIAAGHLMLCPSHTHTGPATIRLGSVQPDPEYLGQLRKHLVGSLLSAEQTLTEVTVSAGRGRAEGVGMNRRLPTERGIRQLPNPDGITDPEVQVLRFDRPDGQPFAILVNFATHPTTLGVHVYEVSADYPGRMQRIVEQVYGAPVYFTQGACGDVKAAAIGADGNFKEGEEQDIDRLGRILAGEVVKTLENCRRLAEPRVRAALKTVPFPYLAVPSEQELLRLVEFHRREVERWRSPDQETLSGIDWEDKHINRVAMHQDMGGWAAEMLETVRGGKMKDHAPGDLQVLRFGEEAALVGVPGELFSEIGIQLKR